jgi:OsmC subfamily peroxiredoxin
MAKRISDAEWRGDLKDGAGTLRLGSGAFEGKYSYKSRFEDGPGTNPEELIAAAHAACFSMALSAALSQKGHAPTSIHTKATVDFGPVAEVSRSPALHSKRKAKFPASTPPHSSRSLRWLKRSALSRRLSRGNQSGGEAPIAGPLRLSIPVLGIDLSLMVPILGAYTLFCQLSMSTESPCRTGRIHR